MNRVLKTTFFITVLSPGLAYCKEKLVSLVPLKVVSVERARANDRLVRTILYDTDKSAQLDVELINMSVSKTWALGITPIIEMMKKSIALILSLAVCQNAHAIESQLLGDVEKLPVHYRIVETCGHWEAENKDGYYRLIVGDVYDGVGSEIYVQWIANPSREKHAELVKTLAFPELNNDHAQYSFLSADCKSEGKYTYIKAKALYEHDETDQIHDISIKLIDIGKYQLSNTVKKK